MRANPRSLTNNIFLHKVLSILRSFVNERYWMLIGLRMSMRNLIWPIASPLLLTSGFTQNDAKLHVQVLRVLGVPSCKQIVLKPCLQVSNQRKLCEASANLRLLYYFLTIFRRSMSGVGTTRVTTIRMLCYARSSICMHYANTAASCTNTN